MTRRMGAPERERAYLVNRIRPSVTSMPDIRAAWSLFRNFVVEVRFPHLRDRALAICASIPSRSVWISSLKLRGSASSDAIRHASDGLIRSAAALGTEGAAGDGVDA